MGHAYSLGIVAGGKNSPYSDHLVEQAKRNIQLAFLLREGILVDLFEDGQLTKEKLQFELRALARQRKQQLIQFVGNSDSLDALIDAANKELAAAYQDANTQFNQPSRRAANPLKKV